MPTQIPSGSALSPKTPQRRRRAAGPRRLGYADGGMVQKWERKLDPDAPAAAAKPAGAGGGSGDSSSALGKVVEAGVQKMLQGTSAVVGPDKAPIGSYAKGGMVKKKKMVGPRRLKYAHGGIVKGKEMTVSTSRDPYKRLPPDDHEILDRELERTDKNRIKT